MFTKNINETKYVDKFTINNNFTYLFRSELFIKYIKKYIDK